MKWTTIILSLIFLLAIGIRLYDLTNVPAGLYIDEASIGYNAYTILHTGNDEHGVTYPLIFQAFGEYKMPVYIYLTALSIAIFGKTVFAVRFFGFFFGTLSVILFYFFLKRLIQLDKDFLSEKQSRIFLLVSTSLLAISPWDVMFSRAGYELTVGTFFFLLGSYFYMLFLANKKIWWFVLSLLSLVLSVYTYNAFRLIGPLTMIVFAAHAWLSMGRYSKKIVYSLIAGGILLLPMLLFSITTAGNVRFAQASAFHAGTNVSLLEKFFLYPLTYIQNYLLYLNPAFLFSLGDGFDRGRVIGFGVLSRWELLFLIIGLVLFLKNWKKMVQLCSLFLFFIAPTAGALTIPSPYEPRALQMVFPLIIFISYGIIKVFSLRKVWVKPLLGILIIIAIYETLLFYHYYFFHYPLDSIMSWGGEYESLTSAMTQESKTGKYSLIVINKLDLNDYIFYKFYNPDLSFNEIMSKQGVWQKPKDLQHTHILYVTADKNDPELKAMPHQFIENIYIPNLNHDVFASLYQL